MQRDEREDVASEKQTAVEASEAVALYVEFGRVQQFV